MMKIHSKSILANQMEILIQHVLWVNSHHAVDWLNRNFQLSLFWARYFLVFFQNEEIFIKLDELDKSHIILTEKNNRKLGQNHPCMKMI